MYVYRMSLPLQTTCSQLPPTKHPNPILLCRIAVASCRLSRARIFDKHCESRIHNKFHINTYIEQIINVIWLAWFGHCGVHRLGRLSHSQWLCTLFWCMNESSKSDITRHSLLLLIIMCGMWYAVCDLHRELSLMLFRPVSVAADDEIFLFFFFGSKMRQSHIRYPTVQRHSTV